MMHVIMYSSHISVLFIHPLTLCGCDLSPGNTLLTMYVCVSQHNYYIITVITSPSKNIKSFLTEFFFFFFFYPSQLFMIMATSGKVIYILN